MPFGAFAPLPLRLGGTDTEGWTARAHARLCADLVALKRTAPLAVFTYTKSGSTVTIHNYIGQNGAGLAYAPDTVSALSTGQTNFKWSLRSFEDPYEVVYPINVKSGKAGGHGATFLSGHVTAAGNQVTVSTIDSAGALADGKVTVVLY